MEQKNINYDTPIACLTLGQFMEVFNKAKNEPTMQKNELPKFLTVPQLAELTGYSKTTINIKNCKKEIPGSKKVGGRVLFETETILSWIESGSVKTKSERLQSLDNNFKVRRATV